MVVELRLDSDRRGAFSNVILQGSLQHASPYEERTNNVVGKGIGCGCRVMNAPAAIEIFCLSIVIAAIVTEDYILIRKFHYITTHPDIGSGWTHIVIQYHAYRLHVRAKLIGKVPGDCLSQIITSVWNIIGHQEIGEPLAGRPGDIPSMLAFVVLLQVLPFSCGRRIPHQVVVELTLNVFIRRHQKCLS